MPARQKNHHAPKVCSSLVATWYFIPDGFQSGSGKEFPKIQIQGIRHHLQSKRSYQDDGRRRARPEKNGRENNFEIDISNDTALINDRNLAEYQVFIALQQAPFDMSPAQQQSVQRFIEQGKGWVGIHAGGLTGNFFKGADKPYWQWFEDFMGGIVYSPHPAFQRGMLIVEDPNHPITQNLPSQFEVADEWYEFNKSPRPNVHVLIRADETSYHQNKPMGDHPIVWVNEKFNRMIYIGIGHDPYLWGDI